uniref:Uncharacterized protein n=1 Tax=Oryza meridionalis TaxID=40149 RepID=A0A0E0CHW6_9ORYZ
MVFDEMPERSVARFNALVAGLTQRGDADEARRVFRLLAEEVLPATELCHGWERAACLLMRRSGGQARGAVALAWLESCFQVATLKSRNVHESLVIAG